MTLVAGIDPGTNGAVAIYDTDTMQLAMIEDLPFWHMTIGKKKRKRLDPVALLDLFEMLNVMGVKLVILEAVGGRPQQSASAGFVFGYTVGLIYMACMYSKIMVETVPPQRWKKVMNIPGKRGNTESRKSVSIMADGKEKNTAKRVMIKAAEGDIINRTNELFPHNRDMFKTQRGAIRMDRMDAALLAKFGGDYVLRTMGEIKTDVELKLAYRNADTGA